MSSAAIDIPHSKGWIALFLVAVTLIAALPRLYDLGAVGFQKDEEYTAWTASQYLESAAVNLPSGLEYRRALPLTLVTALSISAFGTDAEAAYRLPVALLGLITPAILFLLLRPVSGGAVAAVAALLLALSEWHILLSREARMYAPFLLFYLGAGISLWRWTHGGATRHLLIGALMFLVAAALQKLALLALVFPVAPLLLQERPRVATGRVVLFLLIAGTLVLAYSKFFVAPPYEALKATSPSPDNHGSAFFNTPLAGLWTHFNTFYYLYLLAAAGALCGYWLARVRLQDQAFPGSPLQRAVYYLLGITTGLFVFSGQIYAAALALILFYLLAPGLPGIAARVTWRPVLLLFTVACGLLLLGIRLHGLHDGFKYAAIFPFPYLAYFAFISPGVLALFGGTCAWLLFRPAAPAFLRASVFFALAPVIFVGMVSHWGGARYIVTAYPFMIIVAAEGLVRLISALGNRYGAGGATWQTPVALALVLFSIFPGNGIPGAIRAATLSYGEPRYWEALVFPTHPDHKGAGEFVRSRLRDGDIVVAEDVSQQLWYAGRADYWLRSYKDARIYLYKDSQGTLRDIYAGSAWLSGDRLDSLDYSAQGRIWIITSGETAGDPERFLDKQQRAWLEAIDARRPPVYTGRDKVTKVYCLGCG